MTKLFTLLVGATSLALGACTNGAVSATQGLGQPIVIDSAQFLSGTLPGPPPPDGGAPPAEAGASANPIVTDISVGSAVIRQGEDGLVISGHASLDAQTVGVRFADLGSGFWVVPVGAPDPADNGLLTWQLTAEFARDLPPGLHDLLFAAIATNGASGTESGLTVCLDTPVPDNLNICAPSRPPPSAVLSLSWDTPVELTLVVQTPTGVTLGGAASASATLDGGAAATTTTPTDPSFDRESNQNCVIDGIDRTDLVWQAAPPTGTYQVWVDLFRACGQPAVTFNVSLWLPEQQADGTQRLVEQSPPVAVGELLAAEANGGTTAGLFVGSFILK